MGLIDALATPQTITRQNPGSRVNGRWVDPEPTVFEMKVAVQPANPKELVHLPEGDRLRGSIKIYSEAELRTANPRTKTRADVVTYRGEDYEVKSTDLYAGFGLSAYKAIAVRLDEPDQEA